MLLALKIDVDTYRGTREGVPALVKLLERHGADATFLFSLGPDHTGRAIRRVFRPGFLNKVSRTSVVSHYGIRTLLYGTLLPGPDIGKRCAEILRSVDQAGFETGIHCWDHIRWQDFVAGKDANWTRREMAQAATRYREIFGRPPLTHGAAGWQMNGHAYRLEAEFGFSYGSDCRGTHPFWPVVDGQVVPVPQLPSTLPTLDELIGVGDLTEDNVHEHLLKLTANAPATGHVYTLHAELEGMRLLKVFDKLLSGWKQQGYQLVSTSQLLESLDLAQLPRHIVVEGGLEGRSGTLSLQGPALS
jgi:peptidoglycan/xylan/chitin deacetylase (PgdA/CDA1 family)